MSARRRRAAMSALAALVAALLCAVLAGAVDSSGRRWVLIVLALAWLGVAGMSVAGVLRTERTEPPAATDEPGTQPHD